MVLNCCLRDVNPLPQYAEAPCPSLPPVDVPLGVDGDKGLYAPGDLWPTQPVCLTGRLNCSLESSVPCVMREPAPVHNSSFVDWGTTCDGPFPTVYCPLELNDYNAFPEGKHSRDNPSAILYSRGVRVWTPNLSPVVGLEKDFPACCCMTSCGPTCAFPTAWNLTPLYKSPLRLAIGGLLHITLTHGALQVSPTTEHSTHMENQAVMCKEYYPGFNPFRASMDLDIWTTTANRNTSFPLARDPSYCGNV
ncbi:transmembrane protein 131-like [Echinops telfairi]|uniref:Transmembrane protein 131-like n=1 Tax=Echinops telfairi TaxID=9371 RepID=A0AC55DJ20_ECHTE|nr:transmembrane protein 131-like [Echinops telfairi]